MAYLHLQLCIAAEVAQMIARKGVPQRILRPGMGRGVPPCCFSQLPPVVQPVRRAYLFLRGAPLVTTQNLHQRLVNRHPPRTTTEDDLYKAKGNVAGTEWEIRLSRTTEVNAMTNLYGGRLRVEDGAIYKGYGITVHEGSDATVRVKDATLSHSGYDLTFNAGTTLELEGNSQLVGNLMMLSGSFLALDSTMNLEGTLTLGSGIVLGGTLLDDILSMELGDTLTLVSGLESVSIQTQSLMRSLEYTTLLSGELVNASDYFENLKGHSDLVFSYDSNTQTLKIIYAIPEPTTTTLSLLALAALAARRRRK